MKNQLRKIFKAERLSSPTLSLVIPVFNEEHHLGQLCEILDAVPWPIPCEWVFVDDASRDNSYEFIKNLKPKNCTVRYSRNEKNLGKGASLRRAILRGVPSFPL